MCTRTRTCTSTSTSEGDAVAARDADVDGGLAIGEGGSIEKDRGCGVVGEEELHVAGGEAQGPVGGERPIGADQATEGAPFGANGGGTGADDRGGRHFRSVDRIPIAHDDTARCHSEPRLERVGGDRVVAPGRLDEKIATRV